MDSIQRIPKGLLDSLAQREIAVSPLEYVYADMTNDGELRKMLLDEETLYFVVSSASGEMAFAGAERRRESIRPEDIGEVHRYALDTLEEPKILNQVVGGLLVVNIDGAETWLCRFSSARMREMRRLWTAWTGC